MIRGHKPCQNLILFFPKTYSRTMGFSINGFKFVFSGDQFLKKLITLPLGLIVKLGGTEKELFAVPKEIFKLPREKSVKTALRNYLEKLTTNFVNESYLLYDKSDLIKETYITELNIKILIYSSISYFNKKTEKEIFQIISPENCLKFTVGKDTVKNNLDFKLANISRKLPKRRVKKTYYNISITQLCSRRKKQMTEPIETVIVWGQQKFEIEIIEINDDRVLNILKKYKHSYYELTPLGILFPSSITNNTKQIFVTCRELNDAKKITDKW